MIKQEQEFAEEAKKLESGPKLDLGFKEGQTITINIGVSFFAFLYLIKRLIRTGLT